MENTREVPAGGGEGEEAGVPGGVPPAEQALLPCCCLGGWTSGCEGNGNSEKDSQSPGQKLAATLLEDVWLLQE